MDLIPISPTKWRGMEIPYLTDESQGYIFDNKEFFSFPERMGWNKDDELYVANSGKLVPDIEKTPERAAALTQAWLFFGMIYYITGEPVDTSEFITRSVESGEQAVSLKPLFGLISEWKRKCSSWSMSERNAYINGIDPKVDFLGRIFILCIGAPDSAIPPEVSLSIVVLFKTLMLFKKAFFPNSLNPREHLIRDCLKLQRRFLVENGWCKGSLDRISDTLSSIHMLCLAALGPKTSVRDHTLCVDFECRSLIFEMRHAQSDCDCKAFRADGKITSMVNDGYLPLLVVNAKSEVKIQAISQNLKGPSLPYIAISHLCADGLGDPDQNTMFQCQLSRLQARVNEVMRELLQPYGLLEELFPCLFWIDTLCVPGSEGPAKAKGISNMKQIYERAVAVLVIDRDLESVKISDSRLEKTLMISTSLWWTRMWTLQEGIYARNLYFQLGDGLTSLDLLANSRDNDEPPRNKVLPEGRPLLKLLLTGDLIRSISFTNVTGPVLRFTKGRSMFMYMGYRQASRAEDEAVCLAILLGLNVSRVSSLPPDPIQRMKTFILMQRNFPSFLLFSWDAGDNIDEDGFRWAPRTLLNRNYRLPLGFSLPSLQDVTSDQFRNTEGHLFQGDSWADAAGLHTACAALKIEKSVKSVAFTAIHSSTNAEELDILNVHEDGQELMMYWTVHLVTTSKAKHGPQTWSFYLGKYLEPTSDLAILVPAVPRGTSYNYMSIGRLVSVHDRESSTGGKAVSIPDSSEIVQLGDQSQRDQSSNELSAEIVATVILVYRATRRKDSSPAADAVLPNEQKEKPGPTQSHNYMPSVPVVRSRADRKWCIG